VEQLKKTATPREACAAEFVETARFLHHQRRRFSMKKSAFFANIRWDEVNRRLERGVAAAKLLHG
jgi:hypothetical protein